MYVRVKHPVKRWYDWWYPITFSALIGSAIAHWPLQFNLVGERGLVETFNGLLGVLIGFFIAALAAVATFDRPGMDEVMRGESPTLTVPYRKEPLALTRRMYLCLLFGYLTLVTLIAFFAFSLANVLFSRADSSLVGPEAYGFGRTAFIYLYCFVLAHILCHSLLGVHYLSWRAVIADKIIVEPERR